MLGFYDGISTFPLIYGHLLLRTSIEHGLAVTERSRDSRAAWWAACPGPWAPLGMRWTCAGAAACRAGSSARRPDSGRCSRPAAGPAGRCVLVFDWLKIHLAEVLSSQHALGGGGEGTPDDTSWKLHSVGVVVVTVRWMHCIFNEQNMFWTICWRNERIWITTWGTIRWMFHIPLQQCAISSIQIKRYRLIRL